jgi:hypothetical protein
VAIDESGELAKESEKLGLAINGLNDIMKSAFRRLLLEEPIAATIVIE